MQNIIKDITVKDIYKLINNIAPFETAMSWDNVGLLIGDENAIVTSCIIALDCTKNTLDFAKKTGANLIITHHPVIFDPLSKITSCTLQYMLIKENISVISAHTNLDLAKSGVNDCLANLLSLSEIKPFANHDNIGVIGKLPHSLSPKEFATFVKEKLLCPVVSYIDCKKEIKTVAVIGGEGSDYLEESKICDAYLTGEVKHHIYCYAQNDDIQLFTAGHYDTEKCVLPYIKRCVLSEFPSINCEIFNESGILISRKEWSYL